MDEEDDDHPGPPGGPATKKRKTFPVKQALGNDVYNIQEKVFRDNSSFLERLISENNVLFTRPPQMGKTTLLSLAELMLSDEFENTPEGLCYYPPDDTKNRWYVIFLSFGGLEYTGATTNPPWKERAQELDDKLNRYLRKEIILFLATHPKINEQFKVLEGPDWTSKETFDAGELVPTLARSIRMSGERSAKLLFLVDEYDKPIRETLFDFIGEKHPNIRKEMQQAFKTYCSFFSNCKSASNNYCNIKAWATGITPVGLKLISNFNYKELTFDGKFADAVGLRDADVRVMLEEAIPNASFGDREQEEAMAKVKFQFNNLGFPRGSPLYHTGMMNQALEQLQNRVECGEDSGGGWREWVENLDEQERAEDLPSSAFDVIKRADASKLRAVVNKLVDRQALTGYKLQEMSITKMLEEGLDTAQYLTLLVHLGAVSVTSERDGKYIFTSTSEQYRKKHLSALNYILAESILDLLELQSKEEMYRDGESILEKFLSALSQHRMQTLIDWASEKGNRILELQFQGKILEELHAIFSTIYSTRVSQEDKVGSGRSDITIHGPECMIVLELKKKDGPNEPTVKEWENYDAQLRNYVEEHERQSSSPLVVGFVLVMYDDGNKSAVRKLSNH